MEIGLESDSFKKRIAYYDRIQKVHGGDSAKLPEISVRQGGQQLLRVICLWLMTLITGKEVSGTDKVCCEDQIALRFKQRGTIQTRGVEAEDVQWLIIVKQIYEIFVICDIKNLWFCFFYIGCIVYKIVYCFRRTVKKKWFCVGRFQQKGDLFHSAFQVDYLRFFAS
ncbi:MAG: hypothetical protein LUE92_06290 [Clostridiales bacterium]|nr:hypothetical protein [Clostridiales bacterium]